MASRLPRRVGFVALSCAFFACAAAAWSAEPAAGDGFVPLLNGKDLGGWKTEGNWVVEEGGVVALKPRPGERGWTRYPMYLWTEKPYGDFVFDFEFKLPRGGNSGVYLRVADTTTGKGIEVQLRDSHGKPPPLHHHDCGGVIPIAAPSKDMAKPAGEWNRMAITYRGQAIRVDLNGETVVDLKPGDMKRTLPPKGHIGFQDHGAPIWIRNVRIQELATAQ
jgi:hypothetical protein